MSQNEIRLADFTAVWWLESSVFDIFYLDVFFSWLCLAGFLLHIYVTWFFHFSPWLASMLLYPTYVYLIYPVEIVAISPNTIQIFHAIKQFILLCGHFTELYSSYGCIEIEC